MPGQGKWLRRSQGREHGNSQACSLLPGVFNWLQGAYERGRQACQSEGETGPEMSHARLQHDEGAVCTELLTGTAERVTFTMRSVPQVTISPLATSMDMWEMLCFPSWKVAREVRLAKRKENTEDTPDRTWRERTRFPSHAKGIQSPLSTTRDRVGPLTRKFFFSEHT